jgi:hypothetical protein
MSSIYEWANRYNVGAVALTELLDLLDPTRATVHDGRGSAESTVQNDIRLEASRQGCALWRNNNGCLEDPATGRFVRFGLGNDSQALNEKWKSSDLIGIFPQQVERRHIGEVWGRFTAVEVKSPGWKAPKNDREIAQGRFISSVKALGGIGMFAQSVKDVFK